MIEEIVLNYLKKELDVCVCMERPEKPPKKYVLISKAGGGERDHIKNATIIIQSYAESLYNAALLNEEVKEAMDWISILGEISSSKLNSDYEFTDTTKKEYRYQAIYDIYY